MTNSQEKMSFFLQTFGNVSIVAITLVGLNVLSEQRSDCFWMIPLFVVISFGFRLYGYQLGKVCHCGVELTANLCSGIFWIWNLFLWYWWQQYLWLGKSEKTDEPLALLLVLVFLLFLSSLRCPFTLFSWLIWAMSPFLMSRCAAWLETKQTLLERGFGVVAILGLVVMGCFGLRLAWRRRAAYSTLCWATLPAIWFSTTDNRGWMLLLSVGSLLLFIPALLLHIVYLWMDHRLASWMAMASGAEQCSCVRESKEGDSSDGTNGEPTSCVPTSISMSLCEQRNARKTDLLFFAGILLIQIVISMGLYWFRMS